MVEYWEGGRLIRRWQYETHEGKVRRWHAWFAEFCRNLGLEEE